jgi:uncharacterized protein with FMN-binding domain
MDQQPNDKKRDLIVALSILVVIVIIVAATSLAGKKKPSSSADATNTPTTSSSDTATANTSFKDGDYAATGSYSSPGGTQKITIHVTLANGVITASSADSGAVDPEGKEFQADFISEYKQQVVGKKITSVNLSRVAGSSLTSQGFNDAIQQIEQQAQNG